MYTPNLKPHTCGYNMWRLDGKWQRRHAGDDAGPALRVRVGCGPVQGHTPPLRRLAGRVGCAPRSTRVHQGRRANSAHIRQSQPDSGLSLCRFSEESPEIVLSCSLLAPPLRGLATSRLRLTRPQLASRSIPQICGLDWLICGLDWLVCGLDWLNVALTGL